MAGASIPSLSEGGVDVFLERLQSYFLVQKVMPEVQVHTLLLGLSEKQYSLVRDHATPGLPSTMTYQELVDILRHFKSTHNRMTERARFREVRRAEDESVSDFVAHLKNASRYCDFGTTLNENLVEQFHSGINDPSILDKLIDMPSTHSEDIDRIVDRAQEIELNNKLSNLSASSNSDGPAVQSVRSKRSQQTSSTGGTASQKSVSRRCFRCGKLNHVANDRSCPARGKKCNKCGKIGHFANSKFCKDNNGQVGNVDNDEAVEDSNVSTDDESRLYAVKQRQQVKTPRCTVKLEGQVVQFIIDTGACENIVPFSVYDKLSTRLDCCQQTSNYLAMEQTLS
ncbi:uncharacterized protein [Watersipora subatra]|uniref:uncharacterized protein n=1 Tax=Watersipora subatra TaxID=2589382 RepID=UPI00355B6EF9